MLANATGLFSLGYLEKLVKWDSRAGLLVWLACRGTGVLVFTIGVYLHSLPCLLGGQVFQGLASDNLLHFNLNSIYTHADTTEHVSTLMGTSLALYMLGMAIGPAGAGLFPSFQWSFFAAIGLFSIAIAYVLAIISYHQVEDIQVNDNYGERGAGQAETSAESETEPEGFVAFLSPVRLFHDHPRAILQGLSLFLYNMAQAYEINLIFVFASVQFGFTAKENGILLSLVAVVAATYLLSSVFLIPKLVNCIRSVVWKWQSKSPFFSSSDVTTSQQKRARKGRSFDLGAAATSILIQATAATLLSNVHRPSQLYAGAALTALGFAAPSFIKSYFVASLPDATRGVAGLALMETSGGLLSPMVLGMWQASRPDSSVFYVASALLGASFVLLLVGAYVMNGRGEHRPSA
ncbi:hypothetical protein LOZ58_005284 [Ophidiomyces ophidiicola]|nr:hypothetical protein LOZ58_005284 [Ophidiomyces ophidiicola]